MDTTDPGIEFDESGNCNRCRDFQFHAQRELLPEQARRAAFERFIEEVRCDGKGKRYDCIMGVSGGVDSTYAAYIAKKRGLRPLAVHLDNGWDSELAVSNIERTLKSLEIDLYTHVLDWDEFKDLQVAFLKASTPDCEIPTDHAIFAILYHQAARQNVQHIIFGGNTAGEGLSVPEWSSGHYDWRYIQCVHRHFGAARLKSYVHLSLGHMFWFRYVRRIRMWHLLNYIDYDKRKAQETLESELGWRPYSGKHHESIYTRFYQCCILPKKFNADKRKAYLSALVLSGQLSRDEALQQLSSAPCSEAELAADKVYVCKKLGLSLAEFEGLMNLPVRTFWDFDSYEKGLALRAYRKLVRPARNPAPRRPGRSKLP